MSSLQSSWSFSFLLICSIACSSIDATHSQQGERLKLALHGLGRHALDHASGRNARTLITTSTQVKCIWSPSASTTADDGQCDLNDFFILTMRGAPKSVSARIFAYILYKTHVCMSYSTESACFANPSDACAWARMADGGSGGQCYLSDSAEYDPEVLRGRLYCTGSLLDVAARCALASPGVASCTAASTAASSTAATSDGIGGGCAFVNASALPSDAAAAGYMRLASLVTYTTDAVSPAATDAERQVEGPMGGNGGVCVAGWLQNHVVLESLQRTAASNPTYGMLQRDLLGSCDGTDWLIKALAAATANCAAAAAQGAAACDATAGCHWDAVRGTCEAGYDVLYDALYDMNDPWLRAFSDAADECAAAISSTACAAAANPLTLSPLANRMEVLKDALTDPNWTLPADGGSGGGVDQFGSAGAVRFGSSGGGLGSWLLMLLCSCGGTVAAMLLGGRSQALLAGL